MTLESIGDAVISTNGEGEVTFLNPVAQQLTGWTVAEARGRPIDEVLKILDATTRESVTRSMASLTELHRPGHLPGCCLLIRRDGAEIYIEDSTAPIHGRDGKVTGSVIVFRDVTEARRVAEEMLHASQHDFLTGLPNRLLLADRLGQAIALAERHSGEVAVLYIDLDRFKQVNDSLGHMVGDKLLQSVAERLQEQVRTPDTVSRQGGDEFVVLLQEVKSKADAEVVTKRILEAVESVHSIGEYQLYAHGEHWCEPLSRRRSGCGDAVEACGYGAVPGEGEWARVREVFRDGDECARGVSAVDGRGPAAGVRAK